MMDGNSLNLAFEFGPYGGTLDKKAKKDDEQFGGGFVEEAEKGSKSGEQSGSTDE